MAWREAGPSSEASTRETGFMAARTLKAIEGSLELFLSFFACLGPMNLPESFMIYPRLPGRC